MSGQLKIFFFIGDWILLNLSILLSIVIFSEANAAVGSNLTYLIAFSNLTWLFLVMVSNPYQITKGWALSRILKSQIAFVFVHLVVVASLIFFFRQSYPLFQIATIYLVFIASFFSLRLISLYIRKVFSDDIQYRNYILIGRNELSNDVRKFFLMNPEAGYKFQGYLDMTLETFSVQKIQEYCISHEVQEVYCATSDFGEDELRQLINFGLDSLIKVKILTSININSKGGQQFDRMPAIDITTIPLDETRHQFIKRLFDIIFSTVFSILVLSWLLPIIGILIKLDSKGPVFFVQLRSGMDNKPFKCLKLRTMVVNNDADSMQASKGDKRITKLGHFLRKTSIDELPQFLNVLIGNMSIVGPRPHMLKHTDEYSKLIEKFMGRHYVKPGITGLAQCLGYRGETKDLVDMENRVRMDRYYIEHWSFWFDIKIIFLTVVSLIRGSEKAF